MFYNGLLKIRKSALPLAMATLMIAGTYVAASSTTASAATSASSASGVWPGIGKICEPGPGGASSVRGVGKKTINIAVFNDASNTIIPGLEVEFPQQAKAFAQPSVPIREKCGLGQISGYVVSNDSVEATDQVDPTGINPNSVTSGWFGALAKAYPKAVQAAGMGAEDSPSILQSETKYEFAAEAQGWKVVDFPEPPTTVENWTPYVEQYQQKGAQSLWPADSGNVTPFAQAMTTAGYHPSFILLGVQFANSQTQQAVAANPSLPPVYVETQWWPLPMASQNPSTEELVTIMHKYAKGDTIDFDDEEGAEAWLLWAKSASACGAALTVSCVLTHAAATKNWSAGGIEAPVAQLTMSNNNPQPSPCFALLKAEPNKFVLDKAITQPTQSIWNCNPQNVVHLTPQQQASLTA